MLLIILFIGKIKLLLKNKKNIDGKINRINIFKKFNFKRNINGINNANIVSLDLVKIMHIDNDITNKKEKPFFKFRGPFLNK